MRKRITYACDPYVRRSTGDNCDADDVNETTREIAESRRHTESERHQPTTLTGRPRRLLGTQDRSAVVNTRRRCLPCVPATEANIDMSAEEVRDVLVRALERSSGERYSSTDTLPETTREETDDDEPDNELGEPIRRRSTRRGAGRHSYPYGLLSSAWAQWTVTTKTVNELSTTGAGLQTTPYVLPLFGVDAMIRGLRTIGWDDGLHVSWTLRDCNDNLQNYITNFNI